MFKLFTRTTALRNKTHLSMRCSVVNCLTKSVVKKIKIPAGGRRYVGHREFIGKAIGDHEYWFHGKTTGPRDGVMVLPCDVYNNSDYFILPDATKSCGFRLKHVKKPLSGGRHILSRQLQDLKSWAGGCCSRVADTDQDSGTILAAVDTDQDSGTILAAVDTDQDSGTAILVDANTGQDSGTILAPAVLVAV